MKKFIVLSIIALATMQAWACGGWVRPNYYMFSVFNRDLMQDPFVQETKKYWIDYTRSDQAGWACEMLGSIKPEEFDKTDNIIIKTAREKKDTETLNYLRLLVKYLNNDGSGFNRWNYPTKEQIAGFKTAANQVRQKAITYRGTRYKSQYALLVMRCNMTAGKHQDNITYWNNTASKLKQNVYKSWMKDIYAGALYNTGQKDKACEIYSELGDMTSIKYCMRKKRNLKGIKEEYAANPNSPTLIFLVQDFVNNTQETLDNGSNPEIMKYVEATGIYKNEMDGFIDFAGQVLSEGKTKSPSMWEAARGFVNYMAGNQDDAIKQLTNAQNLEGTQRMKDNARACLMLASIKSAEPTDAFFDKMVADYKWLEQKSGLDGKSSSDDAHYRDVFERVTYDALVPKLIEWNMPQTAMIVLGRADNLTSNNELHTIIDNISSSELDDFNTYLTNGQHNSLEKWAEKDVNFDTDTFNDLMGTKLLREGEFQAAINYLEKVPLSLISNQGISYYMARKNYNQEIWLKRQFLSFFKEELTPVESNAKLQYCRDMVELDSRLANATGEERNQLLYNKANLLYQASFKGDCWYLSHYGSGVYDEQRSNEYDFVGMSRMLLRQVEQNTTLNDLRLKCLYALTFITAENNGYCLIENYDWNTRTSTYSIDNTMPHYWSMTRLLEFSDQHPEIEQSYITKCDVIKLFRKCNN